MADLIHYTNLISALKILYSKEVWLSNIANCNDLLEKMCIDEGDTVLSFCCSAVSLNAAMWLSYSGRKNGAAIIFHFKDEKLFDKLLQNDEYKIEAKLIKYEENYFEKVGYDDSLLYNIKDNRFEYEKEYRYYVYLEKMEMSSHITCKLNFECLEGITLVVNQENLDITEAMCCPLMSRYYDNKIRIKIEANEFIN